MTKKKHLFLRIAAGALACLIIGLLLFIANSLNGNPISAAVAKKAMQSYLDQNYAHLPFTLDDKVRYNFKFGEYMGDVSSNGSIDANFTVYYRQNKQVYDDYAYRVLEKSNTQRRMEEEYSALVKSLLSSIDGLEANTSMVLLSEKGYDPAKLQLDMEFDRALFPDAQITVRLNLEDSSVPNIARVLEDSHRLLTENGCKFREYGVFSEHNNTLVMIDGVTPEMIEGGRLTELLEEGLEKQKLGTTTEDPYVVIQNVNR